MDIVIRSSSQYASPPPLTNPASASHLHYSETGFPIIAIAIIGILATAFLLVSYYVFVIKCCLNWHRIDFPGRFSMSRNRNQEDPLMAFPPEIRGLEEAVIRSIPVFKYKKFEEEKVEEGSTCVECAVCLNEFQEDEKLRRIPNCAHFFHIDCIDVWLQSNANCPLCRTSISNNFSRYPIDQIIAPSSTPQNPNPYRSENLVVGGDEDYVVIELGNLNSDTNSTDQTLLAAQEKLNSGDLMFLSSSSPREFLEQRVAHKKLARNFKKITSMGDECIDIRGKDDQFGIDQPIRRSFSMDSSQDRKLFLSIQEVVQQSRHGQVTTEVSNSLVEGSSRSSRRNFFSFGRGSRSAILPVYLEPE